MPSPYGASRSKQVWFSSFVFSVPPLANPSCCGIGGSSAEHKTALLAISAETAIVELNGGRCDLACAVEPADYSAIISASWS
jgi:hypothetical protein